jgi:hypothetical protein
MRSLALFPWPRLKESTDDRDALPADHPELAARGKELAPSVHEALERCGTVKVMVRGAGFHANSVVQIRETPEAIPEPILLGETTVRNGEFVWSHSFDFGFGARVVEGTQVLRPTVSGQQSHVSRDKEVYVFYKEKTRAPDRSCNPLIPASS